MIELLQLIGVVRDALREPAQSFYDRAVRDVRDARGDTAAILALFPSLPRRLGRGLLPDPARELGPGSAPSVDLAAWRLCDAGALGLLTAAGEPPAELLCDLYRHGDMEERTMVLRSVGALPIGAATVELLSEVQRTNVGAHVEALALDSDVVVRALEDDRVAPAFELADFNRLVLKLAFSDLPLRRMIGAERHANAELSRMLQDLATEREAATRKVWHDTNKMIARAPAPGTIARVVGGLEHGDDRHRLAAAEGILLLNREELRTFASERLPREPSAEIRALLERALTPE